MYWALGMAVVGVATYAWLSYEDQSALNSYHSSSRRLTRETRARQQQLNNYKQLNESARDYYKHIELHHNSHLTANACYKLYDEQKQILKLVDEKIGSMIKQIIALKKQRDMAAGELKHQIRERLTILCQFLDEAKQERNNIKQQKAFLLAEVRSINHKTHELKLYIRDNCGQKGRNWYQRGLERRSV